MVSKNKKKEPYYYEGELDDIGAKIVIQVFPDIGMVDTRLIKDNKEIVLSTLGFRPESSGATFINRATDEVSYYDLVLNDSIRNKTEKELMEEHA